MMLFERLVRQRRAIVLAVVLLTAGGMFAVGRIPASIYPELKFERITIVAEGTALGAREQMFRVTLPLEQGVSVVPGLQRMRTRTIRGASELTLTFAPGTDMAATLQFVQSRVNEVRAEMPDSIRIQTERLLPSSFPIITYNVEGSDPRELFDLASFVIRPALSGVPGIGRIDVQGSEVRQVEVIAEPSRLATLGIGYRDFASAIETALGVQAVGRLEQDYLQYLILMLREGRAADDVAAIVVKSELRVGDIATVREGSEDQVRLIRGNGQPAALVNIARQPGANTLKLADSVAHVMRTIQTQLPAGVVIRQVYNQALLVHDAVRAVRDAMLLGALLAVLVLFLFLRQGPITAISAATIPLTMAITAFVMMLTGATFNLMSLGGMAVAIGLVIDDAVVVTENITRHLGLTTDRHEAVRAALAELVWPVTTSTLTTVVVFLPLGLLHGVVGQFFAALSLTLVIAVLVSLVLALTLVPLLAEKFVRVPAAPGGPPRGSRRILDGIGRSFERLAEAYSNALEHALRHPRRLALVGVLLLAAGVVVHRFVETGFLPIMDEGAFVLDYVTPTGTALSETDRELRIVEKLLHETPEIEGTSRRTGAEMGLFATEQNSGDIVARLRRHRNRTIFQVMDELRVSIQAALPRMDVEFVQILTDLINDLAGSAHPIEIKLFGDSLAQLENYATRVAPGIEKIQGVVDLYNGVADPAPELILRVNEVEAARMDITARDVSDQVRAALLGAPGGQILEKNRVVEVRVRAPDPVRFDLLRLGTIPIFNTTGAQSPLSALALFKDTTSPAVLLRENQQQMVMVTAGVEKRSLGSVIKDVKAGLASTPPPPGVRFELGGQYESQQGAFRSLMLVLTLAVLCVTFVMLIQFESFIEPLVILMAAPLSFAGAMLALLITRTQLNVSSIMGIILLVGLIVKNGIILLDFTRHRMREEHEPLDVAIRTAARIRLRPILMTTLCTLFGLLPLALGIGAGSELQRPLALAVIGGLALSTPITLFLVPAFILAIKGEKTESPISG